jgi:hypothetical protein
MLSTWILFSLIEADDGRVTERKEDFIKNLLLEKFRIILYPPLNLENLQKSPISRFLSRKRVQNLAKRNLQEHYWIMTRWCDWTEDRSRGKRFMSCEIPPEWIPDDPLLLLSVKRTLIVTLNYFCNKHQTGRKSEVREIKGVDWLGNNVSPN